MAAAPRATSASSFLALSPAERAAVAAELAGLSARVTALAARLDCLHTALAPPDRPAERTEVVRADHPGFRHVCWARHAWPGRHFGSAAMAVTRGKVLAGPKSAAEAV